MLYSKKKGGEDVGKTSSTVKDRYNAKAYDAITLRVPKGKKETIANHAEAHSESINAFINRAINNQISRDEETAEG